ncbi:MAG: 3-methyl-2-oxobutanoate hydroxymethyltransferase [Methylicorpusculum sp.]|uniref:3-methyl-2-oxobutanoate hydroxymethyltransferase n=1 Tax=Methylicorpusculum sp. TaxID=2713644 RepID=UPI0027182CB1|nr:3-methyl-2-oxobutanoate hydroxymethyltransferase [Methylicorpusculum sp.]MDO8939620.1 3-methyl-2-oxobutanoate hydroxymethyltransferase [Methylicorpusculum sp.]MDO9238712.1 3-methyl-2-oxobutanoate hydroxymethyltransferase [Methylicorpusculum sp.]MDP2203666.1 3-methyl-2-oxobutanoate hydroxymethyltransferase [Methylicorpusculum sp.]
MKPYASRVSEKKRLSVNDLQAMKNRDEKISCLTAYDASFSAVLDKAGIEVILVGDSLGMVFQGHTTTLPVTMDDMLYHTACVSRGCNRALVVADLPFMSYTSLLAAAENAARLIQSGGANMIKLEGARPDVVSFLVGNGVPVCGHLGLLPQFINCLGGYKVQGRELSDAERIISDAVSLEQAGAGLLILECVPASLAQTISQQLTIPVIGIGAGIDCDGQVLVLYDILNIGAGRRPKFSKDFMQGAASIEDAIRNYHIAVKEARFPTIEHSY